MAVLTSQEKDFPQWYQDVVARAELADNGPVRGTMVIRPYAYAIWERLQRDIDDRFKERGVENCYFPMFIPYEYIQQEAETIAGFSPELAIVTHGGGKELAEPLVVRPTSETIINAFFAKWIQGYSDLPLILNQWTNVVRWEQRPRLFLRTTEFLWQEGHTCHETADEARAYALEILENVYLAVMRNTLGIPVFAGRKTPGERFPGAVNTLTCEGMMRDGKGLQMGTSHELGQTFARAFDVTFLDRAGEPAFVWQTSWGVSTRLLGGLVMAHGDDRGLRVPPNVAPIQVVVLAVRDDEAAIAEARRLHDELRQDGVRVALDVDVRRSFGRRAVDWELKGVPVRIQIGPREVEAQAVELVRRDHDAKQGTRLPVGDVRPAINGILDEIQTAVLEDAVRFRTEHTIPVESVDECRDVSATGFALIRYGLIEELDRQEGLKEFQASVRCLVDDDLGVPPASTPDHELLAVVGRAY